MGRKGNSGLGAGGSAPSGTFVELTGGTFIADFGNGVTAMVGLTGDSGKWTASIKQDGKDQFVKDFESKQAAMTFVKNNVGSSNPSGVSTNSTPKEKSVAKALNKGDWDKASKAMDKAGVGSTVSVGARNFKKTSSTKWKTTNTSGNPTWLSTSDVAQEITAETFNGLKAKVHIK